MWRVFKRSFVHGRKFSGEIMIYILFFSTLIITFLNIAISNFDILHPCSVFGIMFSIYEMACIIQKNNFDFIIHANTVIIIIFTMLCMTLLNFFLSIFFQRKKKNQRSLNRITFTYTYISINKKILWIVLLIELSSIILFSKYLLEFSIAYDGQYRSLSDSIVLYSGITKFYKNIYYQVSLSIPIAFKILNPISNACGYLFIYILVNNYFCTKKIDKLMLACVFVFFINIFLSGSRSPYFRVFTMALILYYIYRIKVNGRKSVNLKFWLKIFSFTLLICAGFIIVMPLMGRSLNGVSITDYLFVYVGAPLCNLDQFINSFEINLIGSVDNSQLFGAHTLSGIYAFLSKHFLPVDLSNVENILQFTTSGGKNTGNVYTMFQYPLYDFGYIGCMALSALIFSYYIFSYLKIIKSSSTCKFDFNLFIFSYLYNDIIMAVFSNRFMESITDIGFWKIILLVYLFDFVFIEGKVKIKK